MQLFCSDARKKAIGMGTKEKEDAAKKSTPTTDANDTDTQGYYFHLKNMSQES